MKDDRLYAIRDIHRFGHSPQPLICGWPEWRSVKGMMRRNLPHRQEAAYELEDTALVAKREKELPLEVISSIGGLNLQKL